MNSRPARQLVEIEITNLVAGTMLSAGVTVAAARSDVEQLRLQCQRENAVACTELAYRHYFGDGVPRNSESAAVLNRRACRLGEPVGCNNLGVIFKRAGALSQATDFYQRACDEGDMVACTNLGIVYAEGQGLAIDKGRAESLWRRACDAGNARSCAYLGGIYDAGEGGTSNGAEAARLYGLALNIARTGCSGGDAWNCDALGELYEKGWGVQQDSAEAARLFRRACADGNLESCDRLGSW